MARTAFDYHSDNRVDVAHYRSAPVELWVAFAALAVVAVVVAVDGQKIAVELRSTRSAVAVDAAADTVGLGTVRAGLLAIFADHRDLCRSCLVFQ